MNLQRPNVNDATQTTNHSKSVVSPSGSRSRCEDVYRGNCEVFKSSFRGQEVIYPGPLESITVRADRNYPIDYSHLNIQGYVVGAKGLQECAEIGPNTTIFPNVEFLEKISV